MDAVRKGMRWSGPLDRSLYAHLSGLSSGREWDAAAYDDPVQWALQTLGMTAEEDGSIRIPDRKAIQRRFRDALREAHPDHGGDSDDAALRIAHAILSALKPYTLGHYDQQLDELLVHYR